MNGDESLTSARRDGAVEEIRREGTSLEHFLRVLLDTEDDPETLQRSADEIATIREHLAASEAELRSKAGG